jgi:hypothetical protein
MSGNEIVSLSSTRCQVFQGSNFGPLNVPSLQLLSRPWSQCRPWSLFLFKISLPGSTSMYQSYNLRYGRTSRTASPPLSKSLMKRVPGSIDLENGMNAMRLLTNKRGLDAEVALAGDRYQSTRPSLPVTSPFSVAMSGLRNLGPTLEGINHEESTQVLQTPGYPCFLHTVHPGRLGSAPKSGFFHHSRRPKVPSIR